MSEASLAETKSAEYYISDIQNIFHQNVCSSHVTIVEELGAFFSDSFGRGLSHICLKKLKESLKRSVTDLSKEVDQMVEPVLVMHKITSYLKDKERGIISSPPSKKKKISSSSSTTPTRNDSIGPQSRGQVSGSGSDTVISDENCSNGGNKKICSNCSSPKTPQWRAGPDGSKTLCNACGIRYKKQKAMSDVENA
ncbi:hypothetical protein MKW94_001094, partial [Papaver nudicaule]|nr:hypothetical protein [Papaver nudicaule]